jgi:hypothetical protein
VRARTVACPPAAVMFLLDTNTVINFFMGKGRVTERLSATRPVDVAVSAVSVYEIEVGPPGRPSQPNGASSSIRFSRSCPCFPSTGPSPEPLLRCAWTWKGAGCQSARWTT